jgi:hypothetical protein
VEEEGESLCSHFAPSPLAPKMFIHPWHYLLLGIHPYSLILPPFQNSTYVLENLWSWGHFLHFYWRETACIAWLSLSTSWQARGVHSKIEFFLNQFH